MVAEPGRQADAPWADTMVVDWSEQQMRRFFRDIQCEKMEMAALDEEFDFTFRDFSDPTECVGCAE